MKQNEVVIGLISDTHGLLRPEALRALENSKCIIHAGDIGGPQILTALESIAPVFAVRGNNDREDWAHEIPETRTLEIADQKCFIIHDLHELKMDPASEGFTIVISGHSHRPKIERKEGVLFVNPGSAGPRRFKLPIALGVLRVRNGKADARIIDLHL